MLQPGFSRAGTFGRESPAFLRTLASPPLLLPLLGLLGWIALEIWAGAKLGLWNTGLVPNTVVWTAGTALVLYFTRISDLTVVLLPIRSAVTP